MDQAFIDKQLSELTVSVRNSALDTAAKVAKLYGASDLVIEHILMLKNVREK